MQGQGARWKDTVGSEEERKEKMQRKGCNAKGKEGCKECKGRMEGKGYVAKKY